MIQHYRSRLFAALFLAFLAIVTARAAFAQQPLVSAPPAGSGAPDAPKASAPGPETGKALEPYLFLWILPVGGILAFAAARATDARVRHDGAPLHRRA